MIATHEPTGPVIDRENDRIVCGSCGDPVYVMSSSDGDSAWLEHGEVHKPTQSPQPAAAAVAYAVQIASARAAIRALDRALDAHAAKQAKNPRDWGFVGDLGHLNETLTNARETLQ